MRIFLTGATGFIGSAVAAQLIAAGHQVTGLTRSPQGAAALRAAGVEPLAGDITEPESLRRGAMASDGVIHTAFNHDFSTFPANCARDGLAIDALASALQGSSRPLLITSVVGMGAAKPGALAVENHFNPEQPNPRKASELAGMAALSNNVNLSFIRLSQVHNRVKQGLITPLISLAREKGVSAWIDDEETRWSAVHLNDAAALYLLALNASAPGRRYHAVAEEGISLRTLAEAIGRLLDLPVKSINAADAAAHFGWLSKFAALDMSASGALTQAQLGWQPTGPGLLADLAQMPV